MEKEIYSKIPMFMFDRLAESFPEMEDNRNSTVEYLDHFVGGHLKFIKNFGNSHAIDSIYVLEIAKFFKNVFQLDEDTIKKLLTEFLVQNKLEGFPAENKEVTECVVAYPTYEHTKKEDDYYKHQPIIKIYVLNKKDYIRINADATNNLCDNMEEFPNFLLSSAAEVALYWTNNLETTIEEKSKITQNIFQILSSNDKPAFKKDVM